MNRHAASKRIIVARERGGQWPGLNVPEGPTRRPPSPLAVLRHPLDQREWLTSREALAHAKITQHTIVAWRELGLLPRSVQVNGFRWLYLRADFDHVLRAPRRDRRASTGQNWAQPCREARHCPERSDLLRSFRLVGVRGMRGMRGMAQTEAPVAIGALGPRVGIAITGFATSVVGRRPVLGRRVGDRISR